MRLNRFADDCTDRHTGAEAGIGVLKDDLHLRAHPAQLLFGDGSQIQPLEEHLTARHFVQAEDGAADRRLAAARLADKA